MIYSFDCPYFRNIVKGTILCEFAKITPPDKEVHTEFIKKYCGHHRNYKECPFYTIMNEYYRRKYSGEVDKW